jgi:hypothetical protein
MHLLALADHESALAHEQHSPTHNVTNRRGFLSPRVQPRLKAPSPTASLHTYAA